MWGVVHETRFLTVTCVGLDARVELRVLRARMVGYGRLVYRLHALSEVVGNLGATFKIDIGTELQRALLAAFANGRFYGGGL